uniref:Uncharacterized protein n=1 Tax=Anguilla anguilla TaxID=7936 RepID=A0A0E9W0P6_ANGAN
MALKLISFIQNTMQPKPFHDPADIKQTKCYG